MGVAREDVALRSAIDLRDAAVAGGLSLADGWSSSADSSGVHVEGGVTLEGWRLDELAIRDAAIAGDLDAERSPLPGALEILRSCFGGLVFVPEKVRAREPRIVDCIPANPLAPPAR